MPLSDASRGLIGAADLALMKPSAYLINTSRGPIVDEAALVDVLRAGRIAGAGLDVYDVEPLPVDHPLRSLRNTLLLPHIGYVTTRQLPHLLPPRRRGHRRVHGRQSDPSPVPCNGPWPLTHEPDVGRCSTSTSFHPESRVARIRGVGVPLTSST